MGLGPGSWQGQDQGEEEIQIVLSETFEVNNADIEEVEQSGSIAVQDT